MSTVDVVDVKPVLREPERIYMPQHPDSDKNGFVFRAAVDENEEMVEMLEASASTKTTSRLLQHCAV